MVNAFLYISVSNTSVHTVQSLIHISSSLSVPVSARLKAVLFLQKFSPNARESKYWYIYRKYFISWKTREILASRTEVGGTSGQSSLKPTNPEKSRENGEEWGANVKGISRTVHPTASPHYLCGRGGLLRLSTCSEGLSAYFRSSPEAFYPASSQAIWYCPFLAKQNFAGTVNWGMEQAKGQRRVGGWYILYGTEKYPVPNTSALGHLVLAESLYCQSMLFKLLLFSYRVTITIQSTQARVPLRTACIEACCQDNGRPGSFGSGELRFRKSDVRLTVRRNSVWIRKTNQMSLFVFFISLLIVAQHVSGNHVPIIRS